MEEQAGLDRAGSTAGSSVAGGFWARVQEHKVIQWGVGYLGAALALAHGAELVSHALHWPEAAWRVVVLALIVGFPIALTLAWYHGHRGLARIGAGELAIIALLMLIGAVFFTASLRPGAEHATTAVELAAAAAPPGLTAARSGAADRDTASPAGQDLLPNSVAVLPCVNQSPNPADAYFAAGIHEEILLQLAKLQNLNPIPRRAVIRYAGSDLSIAQIAAELRVQSIMDCSVRYAENRVRIAAQLIDAASSRPLWSDVYERAFADVFAIQADIAMNIANAVGAEFSAAEQQRLEQPPTSSPEAYSLYLRARELMALQSPEAIRQALLLRDRALELDPGFALARVSKVTDQVAALVDGTGPTRPFGNQPSIERERVVREEVERALSLDPNLGLAHSALGLLNLYTWRWTESLARYRVAAEKTPLPLGGLLQYAFLTAYLGDAEEGIRFLERELRFDPNSLQAYQMLGITQGYAHDFDAAVVSLQKAQALAPTNPLVLNWLAYMEIARGNEAEGLQRLEFSEQVLGGDMNLAFWPEFAYAYHRLGRRAEAERFHRDLAAAAADLTLGAGTWAMVSLAIGDNDKALEWLDVAAEKARNHQVDEGFYALMNLRMNFTNDPLLNEPRFAAALSRIRGD